MKHERHLLHALALMCAAFGLGEVALGYSRPLAYQAPAAPASQPPLTSQPDRGQSDPGQN